MSVLEQVFDELFASQVQRVRAMGLDYDTAEEIVQQAITNTMACPTSPLSNAKRLTQYVSRAVKNGVAKHYNTTQRRERILRYHAAIIGCN